MTIPMPRYRPRHRNTIAVVMLGRAVARHLKGLLIQFGLAPELGFIVAGIGLPVVVGPSIVDRVGAQPDQFRRLLAECLIREGLQANEKVDLGIAGLVAALILLALQFGQRVGPALRIGIAVKRPLPPAGMESLNGVPHTPNHKGVEGKRLACAL